MRHQRCFRSTRQAVWPGPAAPVVLEVSVTKFSCISGGAVKLNSDQYNLNSINCIRGRPNRLYIKYM